VIHHRVSKDKLYFKNLDSIRFIAALMVFLQHGFGDSFQYFSKQGTFWERLLRAISNGQMGVSIFFVLSGFLITYLLVSEHEIKSRISIKNFYIRRVLRIWPLFFLVVAISFFVYPFLRSIMGSFSPSVSNIAYHLTFLSNFDVMRIERYYPGQDVMLQNITWSVSIEEQFYLFWPLIFVFLPKRFWLRAIVFVISGSLFFRVMNHDDYHVLYFHSFSVLLDLGIGGMMAYLIKTQQSVRSFFERTSTATHLFFFSFSFLLVLFNDLIFSYDFGIAIGRFFMSLSFAFIISAQAITKSTSPLNLQNFSFAREWGKYTYGIYLLHPIAINLCEVIARALHFPQTNFVNVFAFVVVAFMFTLLFSKLSYTYYESRFLRMKDRFATITTHE